MFFFPRIPPIVNICKINLFRDFSEKNYIFNFLYNKKNWFCFFWVCIMCPQWNVLIDTPVIIHEHVFITWSIGNNLKSALLHTMLYIVLEAKIKKTVGLCKTTHMSSDSLSVTGSVYTFAVKSILVWKTKKWQWKIRMSGIVKRRTLKTWKWIFPT